MIKRIITRLKNIFEPEQLPLACVFQPEKVSFFMELLEWESLPPSPKNKAVKKTLLSDLIAPEKIPHKETRA